MISLTYAILLLQNFKNYNSILMSFLPCYTVYTFLTQLGGGLVSRLCPTLCDTIDCSLSGSSPLSMGFPRQEYWSGLPFPSPGDLPDSGIIHGSPALQADSLPSEPPGKPWHILQRIGFGCKTVPNLFFRKQSMMTQQIIGMKRFILF